MSFFPESLMPANTKSTADDVDGNKYIISASDYNLLEGEIRAIEKSIGVRKMAVEGSGDTITDNCTLGGKINNLITQLSAIQNSMIEVTSGVCQAKGTKSYPDAFTPSIFPTGWATTLSAEITDISVDEETQLEMIGSITLADASGLPDEGYITILTPSFLTPKTLYLTEQIFIISPNYIVCKNGEQVNYTFLGTKAIDVSVDSSSTLPNGLTLSNGVISGTLDITLSENTSVVTTKFNISNTITFELKFYVGAANTPFFATTVMSNPSGTVGKQCQRKVNYEGYPTSFSYSGLPPGMTGWNDYISGTPTTAGTYTIAVSMKDQFAERTTNISFEVVA